MKIIQTIKDYTFKISGCLLMLIALFYLHFYELNPIYEAKSNK